MRPILANRLFVPEANVDSSMMAKFRHHWTKITHEERVGDDGLVEVDANGKAIVDKKKEPIVIDGNRHILTGLGTDYIGLPRGSLKEIKQYLPNAIDIRSRAKLPFDLQVAEHVHEDGRWPDQERCVDSFCKKGSGIVLGQTGAGKTVVGLGIVAQLNMQTLIMTTMKAGYKHWENDFREHSNINEVEKKLGRRLIGPYQHKESYPIAISTAQTFLHKNSYLRAIKEQNRFGLVIADEVHELVTPEHVRVLTMWAPKHWLGLTATIDRSDHKEVLAYWHLGPVVAELKADQMRPTVRFIETNFSVPSWMEGRTRYSRFGKWRKLLDMITVDEDRNDIITHNVMEDIDSGRFVAVIGERTAHFREIYRQLKQNGYDVAYIDGKVRGPSREKYFEAMRKKKLKCICAGKVLRALVNIKTLDCMHVISPMSGEGRIRQLFGRTRRPDDSKPTPLIRYYVDSGGQLDGSYKKVRKVCQDEGWNIKYTNVAQSKIIPMTKWGKGNK